MNLPGADAAALVYAALTALVVAFQLCLAAGAPWGAYAMGGRYPGRFPPALRTAAVVQAVLLAVLAAVVLVRAGVLRPDLAAAARWPAWGAVAVSGLALAMNLATPSRGERRLWAPVAAVMLLCAVRVAAGA